MKKKARRPLYTDGDWIVTVYTSECTGSLVFERIYNNPGMPIENRWTFDGWN